jgi:hydrogenase maturation protease
MEAGGDPGTIYRFGIEDVAEAAVTTSLHEVDLLAALRFLTSGHRPEITVLGVEPETIETGLELSPSVQATLPRLVTAAQEIVRRWHT